MESWKEPKLELELELEHGGGCTGQLGAGRWLQIFLFSFIVLVPIFGASFFPPLFFSDLFC